MLIWKKSDDGEVEKILRLKEKERHARYYQEHREEILKRQKLSDELRDRKTPSKKQYLAHREKILSRNRERYQMNKETRKAEKRAEKIEKGDY